MLRLHRPTPTSWVEAVEGDLPGLLADHAHCELKAAQSALSLVARYGAEHPEIVPPLVALAREETDHFDRVQHRIAAGGYRMTLPAADEYVGALRKGARANGGEAPALLDRLLVSALIEARSCERFMLLSAHLRSAELRAFYGDLMTSEARHHRLFTRLAEQIFGAQAARARLSTIAEVEGSVVDRLPLGPTVHG